MFEMRLNFMFISTTHNHCRSLPAVRLIALSALQHIANRHFTEGMTGKSMTVKLCVFRYISYISSSQNQKPQARNIYLFMAGVHNSAKSSEVTSKFQMPEGRQKASFTDPPL